MGEPAVEILRNSLKRFTVLYSVTQALQPWRAVLNVSLFHPGQSSLTLVSHSRSVTPVSRRELDLRSTGAGEGSGMCLKLSRKLVPVEKELLCVGVCRLGLAGLM